MSIGLDPTQQPFVPVDQRERRILEQLKSLVSEGIAAFFLAACRNMASEKTPACSNIVAHLLREVESAIRGILDPVSGKSKQDSHAKSIDRCCNSLDIPFDGLLRRNWHLVIGGESRNGFHARAHRSGLDMPPPITKEFKDWWDLVLATFDGILKQHEDHYAQIFITLDELLQITSPGKAHIGFLTNRIPRSHAAQWYFFKRLEHPGWLRPLRKKGFFRNIPAIEMDKEQETIAFPPWPAGQYLERMAKVAGKQNQREVLNIIRYTPKTDNYSVILNLIRAALNLPDEELRTLAPVALRWFSPHLNASMTFHEIGKVIDRLLNARCTPGALQLTRRLFSQALSGRKQRSRYAGPQESYELDDFLRTHQAKLVSKGRLEFIDLLVKLLDQAVRQSEEISPRRRGNDYSGIWRHSVEEEEQFSRHEIRGILVNSLRDACIQLAKERPTIFEKAIVRLEDKSYSIFKRIALYVLAMVPNAPTSMVRSRLSKRSLFASSRVRPEYSRLLREKYHILTQTQQKRLLKWIYAGPDLKRIRMNITQSRGSSPSNSEMQSYKRRWQAEWLSLIRAHLDMDERAKYEAMVQEVGEPEPLDRPQGIQSWSGPTSPKTKDDLESLSNEQLFEFLENWEPKKEHWSPTREGLSRILTSIVAAQPNRFAQQAGRFKALDPTYCRALVSGLEQASRNSLAFDWQPILEFSNWVITQPPEIPGRTGGNMDQDADWSGTRRELARLLRTGFSIREIEVSFSLREKSWSIISNLIEDPDPSPEREKEAMEQNDSGLDLAINSVRGVAMDALCWYALWVDRNLQPEMGSAERQPGFSGVEEAKEAIERHLNLSHDPSLAIRAVFGEWFSRLLSFDREWALAHLDAIFPRASGLTVFLDAAWNSYIVYGRYANETFRALEGLYRHALESSKDGTKIPTQLGNHIMAGYVNGILNMDERAGLFNIFFDRSSGELQVAALGSLGRSIGRHESSLDGEVKERLKLMWDYLIARFERDDGNVGPEALACFGWWFSSGQFDEEWSLITLERVLELANAIDPDHQTFIRLASLAPRHSLRSVRCIAALIGGSSPIWRIDVEAESVRIVLQTAINSGDSEAADIARRVIGRLTAKGYTEFRNLLQEAI